LYADPEVQAALRARWGDNVFTASGEVDRPAVAAIVFPDPPERRWLEELLHPLVGREWLRWLKQRTGCASPPEFVVAEVPLLFESNLQDRYDAVLVVTAPLPQRMQRVGERARGGEGAADRAAAQLPEADKVARADYVIHNTGSFEELERSVRCVMDDMREKQRSPI